MSMFFRWLVFGLAALLFNFPLISTLLTSLKSEGEIVSNPSILIQSPTFANYVKIFEMADRFDILHFLWNSLVISALGAFFALLLAFPAAYVIVRTGFGRNWLLPFVLNLRALPLIIFAIPLYMMFQAVGLLDTLFGLALIMCIINLPLTLALLSSTQAVAGCDALAACLVECTAGGSVLAALGVAVTPGGSMRSAP